MATDHEPVTLPRWLVRRAIECIARAEVKGAFRECAAPQVGARTLQALQDHLDRAAP